MAKPSPFPGMDPWLEPVWESVHVRLIVSLCNQIGARLPSGLFAEVEETVYVIEAGEERDRPIPDVSIFRGGDAPIGTAQSTAAVARPYLISVPAEPRRERHVVIRSLETDRPLVTAIELLSPTNKRRRLAREAYVAKRAAYRGAGASVLEIDLIRAGRHLIDIPPDDIPIDLITPYKACVHRGVVEDDDEDGPARITAEYYPLPLRSPLPTIALPLRTTDPDLPLELQRSIDEVYASGQYGTKIDYARPLDPPLSPADAAWAAERIAAVGSGTV